VTQPVRHMLIIGFAFSICMASSSTAVATNASSGSGLLLTHIAMVTTKTGWGTTLSRVVRTMDGGRTWRTVLTVPRPAPLPTNGPYFAFASIGLNHAWAVSSSPRGLQTYRSANAGATWTHTKCSMKEVLGHSPWRRS
jgi:photosystem II stability/assembly factor-like uncharacterized protein